MTTCANCGSTAFYADEDPLDLGHPDLVCAVCSRVHGVTLRLGDLPDPDADKPRSLHTLTCQHCGKTFHTPAKDRLARKFCGRDCGYAGRSVHPRKERSA